jgi:hypothetical protein
MGMGEPLANYDAVWQAVEMLNSPCGFGIGARNMVISTVGLVPEIKRLSQERLQIGLAISLHASENALRSKLVPINNKYPLEQLIPACREYCDTTGRRLSFEYVLFEGINDSISRARALAQLLTGLNCHVNLIPANWTANKSFGPPNQGTILAFQRELKRLQIACTLRKKKGVDIDAGCGQLRSRFMTPPQCSVSCEPTKVTRSQIVHRLRKNGFVLSREMLSYRGAGVPKGNQRLRTSSLSATCFLGLPQQPPGHPYLASAFLTPVIKDSTSLLVTEPRSSPVS